MSPCRLHFHPSGRQRALAWTLAIATSLGQVTAGGIYWTDRGASLLKHMEFDGSQLRTIPLSGEITSPGSNIRGIAVLPGNGPVYWADNGSDRLLRANADGTSSTILVSISGGNAFPADIRLDLVEGHLYWCDQLRNRIQRSKLDGSEIVDVIPNAAGSGPYFLDIDRVHQRIYWGDFEGGHIYRASLDGSNRQEILNGNNNTRGVRVDPIEGFLYWVNRDDKKIHRCPLSAFENGSIPLAHPSVQTLYSGLDTPHGLVLDIQARKLYWADTGTNTGSGTGERAINRGDFDGTSPQEILGNGTEPWDVDLDPVCSTYPEWQQRYFRRDAAVETTAREADPDHDGRSNLEEYAVGTAPLSVDASGPLRWVGSLTADLSGLVLQHDIRRGITDITVGLQVSSNLVDWADVSSEATPVWEVVSKTELREDLDRLSYRWNPNRIPQQQSYTRLRIQSR